MGSDTFYGCTVAKSVDEVEISYTRRPKLSFYRKNVEGNASSEGEEEGEENPSEKSEENVLSEESEFNEQIMSQIASQLVPTMTAIDFQNVLLDIVGCAAYKLTFTPQGFKRVDFKSYLFLFQMISALKMK
jgi:hypothetical protein